MKKIKLFLFIFLIPCALLLVACSPSSNTGDQGGGPPPEETVYILLKPDLTNIPMFDGVFKNKTPQEKQEIYEDIVDKFELDSLYHDYIVEYKKYLGEYSSGDYIYELPMGYSGTVEDFETNINNFTKYSIGYRGDFTVNGNASLSNELVKTRAFLNTNRLNNYDEDMTNDEFNDWEEWLAFEEVNVDFDSGRWGRWFNELAKDVTMTDDTVLYYTPQISFPCHSYNYIASDQVYISKDYCPEIVVRGDYDGMIFTHTYGDYYNAETGVCFDGPYHYYYSDMFDHYDETGFYFRPQGHGQTADLIVLAKNYNGEWETAQDSQNNYLIFEDYTYMAEQLSVIIGDVDWDALRNDTPSGYQNEGVDNYSTVEYITDYEFDSQNPENNYRLYHYGTFYVKCGYTKITYTVTIDQSSGCKLEGGATSFDIQVGDAWGWHLPTASKTHYDFKHWNMTGWSYPIDTSEPFRPISNEPQVTLRPYFQAHNYSITYNLNGGWVEDKVLKTFPTTFNIESEDVNITSAMQPQSMEGDDITRFYSWQIVSSTGTKLTSGINSTLSNLETYYLQDITVEATWCSKSYLDKYFLYDATSRIIGGFNTTAKDIINAGDTEGIFTFLYVPGWHQGKSSFSVAESAFANIAGIEGISLLDGVTCVDKNAFKGMTDLEWVDWTYDLQSLGNNAFADCTNLSNINEIEVIDLKNATSMLQTYGGEEEFITSVFHNTGILSSSSTIGTLTIGSAYGNTMTFDYKLFEKVSTIEIYDIEGEEPCVVTWFKGLYEENIDTLSSKFESVKTALQGKTIYVNADLIDDYGADYFWSQIDCTFAVKEAS